MSVEHALVEIRSLNRSLNRIESSLESHVDDAEWRQRATKAKQHIERRHHFLVEWLLESQDDSGLLAVAYSIIERLHCEVEGGLVSDELRVLNRLRVRFPSTMHA